MTKKLNKKQLKAAPDTIFTDKLSKKTEDKLKKRNVVNLEPKLRVVSKSLAVLDDIIPGAKFFVCNPHQSGGVTVERIIEIMQERDGISYLISRSPIDNEIQSGTNGKPYESASNSTWSKYLEEGVLRHLDDEEANYNIAWQKKHLSAITAIKDSIKEEIEAQNYKKRDAGTVLFGKMLDALREQNTNLNLVVAALNDSNSKLDTLIEEFDDFKERQPLNLDT